jgi:hypothetical protein
MRKRDAVGSWLTAANSATGAMMEGSVPEVGSGVRESVRQAAL